MTTKKPILIVTCDRWSSYPYIVFEGEGLIGCAIAEDWINDALIEAHEDNAEITREQIENSMVSDFKRENDLVDEFWEDRKICRTGNEYYKYDIDGMAQYIGNFDSINEAIEAI